MTSKLCEKKGSVQWIPVQNHPQEIETPKVQSKEDKKYVPREKNRTPQVPRHHRWTTGRSRASLHR